MAAALYPDSMDALAGMTNPGMKFTAIIPDDANDLVYVTRGIVVATPGVVRLKGYKDAASCDVTLAAGVIHPIMAVRIYATATTATGIVAVN